METGSRKQEEKGEKNEKEVVVCSGELIVCWTKQTTAVHTHTSMEPSSSSLILNAHTPLPITDLIYEENTL